MTPVIIIPARYRSSRFPGKPLFVMEGRPLIEWTWLMSSKCGWPVHIATDDDRIANCARSFGADVIMTGDCANGTERCAEAVQIGGIKAEIIVNWQGDSPLCRPAWARACVDRLEHDPSNIVATPVFLATERMCRRLRADHEASISGATTAAISGHGRALYFSKAVIPYRGPLYFHVGLYAYARAGLMRYGRQPSPLEQSEGLEQLRFYDLDLPIAAVEVETKPIWEVNNPGDVAIVGPMLEMAHAVA